MSLSSAQLSSCWKQLCILEFADRRKTSVKVVSSFYWWFVQRRDYTHT